MKTRIYLVRHVESEWNNSGRYTGQQDVPLSELGRQQAELIAGRLEQEPLTEVYASPLARASATAEAIARRKGLRVCIEPGLAEIHHGAWEGLTAQEVATHFPLEHAEWQTAPHRVSMPQGESLDDVARRAAAVLRHVVEKHKGETIALCSHDAVLRVLILIALGLAFEHFWAWSLENASLSLLESKGDQRFRLALLNDTTHLLKNRSEYDKQAL